MRAHPDHAARVPEPLPPAGDPDRPSRSPPSSSPWSTSSAGACSASRPSRAAPRAPRSTARSTCSRPRRPADLVVRARPPLPPPRAGSRPASCPRRPSSSSTSFPRRCTTPTSRGRASSAMLEGLGLGPGPDRARDQREVRDRELHPVRRGARRTSRSMGFSIAVDDIGAGYSGLEKIAHLNPRYLKFDMQLVRDIDASYVRARWPAPSRPSRTRWSRRSSPRASSARAS